MNTYIKECIDFGWGAFNQDLLLEKSREISHNMPSEDNPHISVIIPAYKEECYILACLRSFSRQTYRNFEVIVVCNGEEEGSLTHLISQTAGTSCLYLKEGHISKSRQAGLMKAKGNIVVSCDADAIYHQDFLMHVKDIFLEHKDLRFASGGFSYIDGGLSAKVFVFLMMLSWRTKDFISGKVITGMPESCNFFKREEAIAAGGYNTSIRMSEGYSLFNRMGAYTQKKTFFMREECTAYTSARRFKGRSPLLFLFMLNVHNVLRFFGRDFIDEKRYPNFR